VVTINADESHTGYLLASGEFFVSGSNSNKEMGQGFTGHSVVGISKCRL
jgi:hypothetical protein